MHVDVTPQLGAEEQQALLEALERAGPGLEPENPYRGAWRAAGLREGVDDEADVRYAFSPRSTRGATRA